MTPEDPGHYPPFPVTGHPTATLEKHSREYPHHKSGVPVPDKFGGLTVADLCNRFLTVNNDDRDSSEITDQWFNDLKIKGQTCRRQYRPKQAGWIPRAG
jgi:hypothetical protein